MVGFDVVLVIVGVEYVVGAASSVRLAKTLLSKVERAIKLLTAENNPPSNGGNVCMLLIIGETQRAY